MIHGAPHAPTNNQRYNWTPRSWIDDVKVCLRKGARQQRSRLLSSRRGDTCLRRAELGRTQYELTRKFRNTFKQFSRVRRKASAVPTQTKKIRCSTCLGILHWHTEHQPLCNTKQVIFASEKRKRGEQMMRPTIKVCLPKRKSLTHTTSRKP